jgi:toxin ParE1/3/4
VRVVVSALVEGDLEAIAEFIAEGNPRRALSFVREIREKFSLIGRNPLAYRIRPEIGDEARLGLVGRYVILFRVVDDTVRIERVIYGGRDLVDLLDEE